MIVSACWSAASADIDWEAATHRLAAENQALAQRPQGHDGTYFVICTLYYTPMESGFTAERGFDVTPETRPGLKGRTYPREFLQAIKKEGFGRLITAVNGLDYIRYEGEGLYGFAKHVTGRGGVLVPGFSAATRRGQSHFRYGVELRIGGEAICEVFESEDWKVMDTGGGLRRWHIDLYWGEDEPLGPGRLAARPKNTTFEFAFSEVQVKPSAGPKKE